MFLGGAGVARNLRATMTGVVALLAAAILLRWCDQRASHILQLLGQGCFFLTTDNQSWQLSPTPVLASPLDITVEIAQGSGPYQGAGETQLFDQQRKAARDSVRSANRQGV
jgi:hypothetical protein